MLNSGSKGSGTAYAPLQEVRAYWEGLRRGSAIPTRASIDPRGMKRGLEHIFLLERVAAGEARFRLAGMHLVMVMGMEVRGLPFSSLFDPDTRAQVRTLIESVFGGDSAVEIAIEAERGIGRPSLEGRILLLPVLGDDGVCNRVLGCLVTVGGIGRSPRRFSIARQVIANLGPAEALAQPMLRSLSAAGFQEPSTTFKAPHLRLVKTDGGQRNV